jgi:hypothetical protein
MGTPDVYACPCGLKTTLTLNQLDKKRSPTPGEDVGLFLAS